MAYLEWKDELNTHISVIDNQHKRILDYINQLHDVYQSPDADQTVDDVIIALVDYTLSHFEFEEALLEEAGFLALIEHKKNHNAFRNTIFTYRDRVSQGEDVKEELLTLLQNWLFGHIQHEDGQYVAVVRQHIDKQDQIKHQSWVQRKISQIFKPR